MRWKILNVEFQMGKWGVSKEKVGWFCKIWTTKVQVKGPKFRNGDLKTFHAFFNISIYKRNSLLNTQTFLIWFIFCLTEIPRNSSRSLANHLKVFHSVLLLYFFLEKCKACHITQKAFEKLESFARRPKEMVIKGELQPSRWQNVTKMLIKSLKNCNSMPSSVLIFPPDNFTIIVRRSERFLIGRRFARSWAIGSRQEFGCSVNKHDWWICLHICHVFLEF